MGENHDRRSLLRKGGLLGLSTVAGYGLAKAETCAYTPAQMEGPFYPVTRRSDVDFDLTVVNGRAEAAAGAAMLVVGRVLDEQCRPLVGALVEIWQANTHGKYDHPGDDNPAPLDPNFQYWGRVTTGLDGAYSFKTVKPGLYPGRTRHIHFKVVAAGFRTLTTQLYFDGEPRNATDGVYRSLTQAQRRLVTTALPLDPVRGLPVGTFDITLGRGAGPRLTPELD